MAGFREVFCFAGGIAAGRRESFVLLEASLWEEGRVFVLLEALL